MDTTTAVVIDAGSNTCRGGLSRDTTPPITLRTLTGKHPDENDIYSHFKATTLCKRHNDILAGDELSGNCGHLTRTYPVSRGTVEDWSHMESIIMHIYNRLCVKPEDQPILLTEPPLNPKSNRTEAAEVCFERISVPYFHMTVDTPLVLPGLGRDTGVAVCCGDGVTSVVSVFEGYTFPMSALRQNLAGRDVTEYLGQLMAEKGNNILPWATGFEILRKIKEATSFATLNDINNTEDDVKPMNYTLPDGKVLSVAEERCKCSDVLFQSSLLGKEYSALHTLINDSVQQADMDCRRELYRNIVLTGGTAKIPGLIERVQSELETIAPDKVKVNVTSSSQGQTAVWCGAANLASSAAFQSQWISKTEYQENGGNVVHKKCWSFT